MNALLTEELFSTTIHGITGQNVVDGYLQPGTLVRGLVAIDEADDEIQRFRFLASTDGGKTWFQEESYSRPVTEDPLGRPVTEKPLSETCEAARRYLG